MRVGPKYKIEVSCRCGDNFHYEHWNVNVGVRDALKFVESHKECFIGIASVVDFDRQDIFPVA